LFALLKGNILQDNDQKSTIAVLDGIRAIACLSVIAFHINLITLKMHFWQPSVGTIASAVAMTGYTGVTLFFVLSGLLLFLPYAKALLFDGQWPSTRQFYLRRAFRIIPGYYVSLCLMVLLLQPQYLQPAHWKELGLFLVFFMDSSQQTYQHLNGPFWTLAVEWQFYLLLPLLALAFRKFVGVIGRDSLQRRWWTLCACLVVVIAWGFGSRYLGKYFMAHPTETFLVPRSVLNVALFFLYGQNSKFLESFAIGMLIASCYILARRANTENVLNWLGAKISQYSVWLWRAGIVALLIMALWNGHVWFHNGLALFDTIIPVFDWLGDSLFPLGYGLCVLAVLFGPAELKRPFEWAPLRWVGLISYSLYIWHLPIIAYFSGLVAHFAAGWNPYLSYVLFWLCAALVVIPFSYLFYKCIELPWTRLGGRLRDKMRKKQTEMRPN